MSIRLHICTKMESEQLLVYSWLQATSRHQRAYTPHDDPGSGHKPVIASGKRHQ
ncbi:unnamed protein product [Rodentolepis nana]|uniref:Uncharacterized protein n=1 Tax=Rodentolepis nana TaxID=102285 RepID=A0A0R3TII4_RODNA|nr:unnamed protein product [Rodentolepis nana]